MRYIHLMFALLIAVSAFAAEIERITLSDGRKFEGVVSDDGAKITFQVGQSTGSIILTTSLTIVDRQPLIDPEIAKAQERAAIRANELDELEARAKAAEADVVRRRQEQQTKIDAELAAKQAEIKAKADGAAEQARREEFEREQVRRIQERIKEVEGKRKEGSIRIAAESGNKNAADVPQTAIYENLNPEQQQMVIKDIKEKMAAAKLPVDHQADASKTSVMAIILFCMVGVVVFIFWFFPSLIALGRVHLHRTPIIAVNILSIAILLIPILGMLLVFIWIMLIAWSLWPKVTESDVRDAELAHELALHKARKGHGGGHIQNSHS